MIGNFKLQGSVNKPAGKRKPFSNPRRFIIFASSRQRELLSVTAQRVVVVLTLHKRVADKE
jgi:hypothetical protein